MKLTISILTILIFTSCKISRDFQPERVNGIPLNAFWVGGPDGGQWYLIENINKNSATANFKIFNDQSGSIVASRVFDLKCNSEVVIDWNNLNYQINAYDGQRVILTIVNKDGEYCYFQ